MTQSSNDEMQVVVQAATRLFQDLDQGHMMPLFQGLAPDLQQALRTSLQGGAATWLTWLAQAHMAMILVRTDQKKSDDAVRVGSWVLAQIQPVIDQCPLEWQIHYAGLRMNLGTVYLLKNRVDEAAIEFEHASNWFGRLMTKKAELVHPCLLCWLNQAGLWGMQDRLEQAAKRFRQVHDVSRDMLPRLESAGVTGPVLQQASKSFRAVQIEAMFGLGKIQLRQNLPSDALFSMGQAANLCRQLIDDGELDHRHLLAMISGAVGDIYKQFGQLDSAYEMFQHSANALEQEIDRGRMLELGLLCRVWSDALECSWNAQKFPEAETLIRRSFQLLMSLRPRKMELLWAVEFIQRYLKLVTATEVERDQVEMLARTYTLTGN